MTLHRRRPGDLDPGGAAVLEELDALLAEVGDAARSSGPAAEFAAALLRSVSRATGAKGAVLWAKDSSDGWRAEYTAGTVGAGGDGRVQAVRRAAETGTARLVALESGAPGGDGERSVVAPMVGRVLEVVVVDDVRAAGPDGTFLLEVAQAFAEVGNDYFARRELTALRGELAWARQLESFTRSVHGSFAIGPTSYAIVNDGRALVGCDRLTVFDRRGRVLAVSGVEVPDRRAAVVRRLERLAQAALRDGGRFWRCRGEAVEGESGSGSPEVTECWRECAEPVAGASADVAVLTGRSFGPSPPEPVGVLVAEWFGRAPDGADGRVAAVAARAEQALRNVAEATPGAVEAALGACLAPVRRHLSRTAAVIAVLAACLAALVLVRVEFTVAARGRLVPERSREVFAPADGVVASVRVRHGDHVKQGAVLLTLDAPLLESERERVAGELAAARERLRSVQAERATGGPTAERPEARASQLAADEREFAERVASLERQLAIVTGQTADLVVRSPLGGVVLTWEADERLESRPVRRGQRLLTVADPEGDWRLDLSVPDRGAAHLLEARKRLGPDLAVEYRLATEPQRTYHTSLGEVAYSMEADESGRPRLRAWSRVERADVPLPRPGATVVAAVRCGRRPLGYVWFHEIYESLLLHLPF
jgi:biotin carboxyl carrier protein